MKITSVDLYFFNVIIHSSNEGEGKMDFFGLTSHYKEMKLLEHITNYPNTTQSKMAEVIQAAPSMVNSYIRKLEKENYLKRVYQSKKIVDYKITNKGIKRKNYLQIVYMKELMTIYREGQKSVTHFLESIQQKGLKRVLLYGAGEVAEIILDICRQQEYDIEIVGIIDDNEEKPNTQIRKIDIYPNEEIHKLEHDGIVITSYTYEQEIIKKLKNMNYPIKKIVRYFET